MRYMNLNKWNGQGYQAPAGDPAPAPAPAPAGDPAPAPAPAGEDAEYQAFKAWQASGKPPAPTPAPAPAPAPAGDPDDKNLTAFERMRNAEKLRKDNERDGTDKEQQIRNEITFDASFDAVIDKNKKMFTANAEAMRKGASGLKGGDLMHTLKCLAVQDFFSNDQNVEILTAADQAIIKNKVLGAHERNINSNEAYKILEGALNIATRLDLANNYTNNNSGGDGNTDTPQLDAFIQRSRDRVRGIKTESK